MNRFRQWSRRTTYRVVALLFLLILVIAAHPPSVYADSQMTARSIKMSSSAQAATNVIYTLAFTTNQSGASSNIGGLVIDFCDNNANIGASCTTGGTSLNTNKSTLALANQSGITGWSVDTTNSSATKLVLTRTASSIATGVSFSIDLGTAANGITNPNTTNTTFYARILTFATTAAAQAYTSTTTGTYVDAGGVALSTANQITITAKVGESLTFCVYTGANCGAGGNSLTLGDANGYLSTGTTNTANGKFDLATNAQSGAIVRMKGDTLKSGSNSISQQGTSCTADATGTSQFGLRVTVSGSPLAAVAPYNCSSGNHALDTNAGTGTLSTYGQTIANTGGGVSASQTGTMEFDANISNITPAGIYTTTMTFIATAQY